MDEKKANLYRARLIMHLHERLVQFTSLSYNELATIAIDQERMMKAVAEADEKKRKKMPGSVGNGSSSGAPPHGVYPTWGPVAPTTTAAELGQSPTIPTAAIPAAIATTTTIQLCSYPTAAAGYHQATTAASRQ
jgi:hypothetical protein